MPPAQAWHRSLRWRLLFELTQDYGKRALWDPLTSEAYLVNSSIAAKGELVRCTAKNGMSMDTVYVAYEPDKVAAVKLVKGPYIFDQFAGGWRFKEIAPGTTLVQFSYNVSTKPKWLAWLLTPIIGAAFRHETRKRIRALKAFAEGQSAKSTPGKRPKYLQTPRIPNNLRTAPPPGSVLPLLQELASADFPCGERGGEAAGLM